jgi:hypothetical protein
MSIFPASPETVGKVDVDHAGTVSVPAEIKIVPAAPFGINLMDCEPLPTRRYPSVRYDLPVPPFVTGTVPLNLPMSSCAKTEQVETKKRNMYLKILI